MKILFKLLFTSKYKLLLDAVESKTELLKLMKEHNEVMASRNEILRNNIKILEENKAHKKELIELYKKLNSIVTPSMN